MKALGFSFIMLLVLALGVSAYHTYDYAKSGYGVPGHLYGYPYQSTQIVKTIGKYNTASPTTDFRKSSYRPVTRIVTGPSELRSASFRRVSDTGSGLYVPYEYTTDMTTRNLDVRKRGASYPYHAVYGVEKQALPSSNFG